MLRLESRNVRQFFVLFPGLFCLIVQEQHVGSTCIKQEKEELEALLILLALDVTVAVKSPCVSYYIDTTNTAMYLLYLPNMVGLFSWVKTRHKYSFREGKLSAQRSPCVTATRFPPPK
jgi:hypothetical protein